MRIGNSSAKADIPGFVSWDWSTFATVRLRQRRTKGSGTQLASLVMVYKLVRAAERRWRKLNEPDPIKDVFRGRKFVDGIMQDAA